MVTWIRELVLFCVCWLLFWWVYVCGILVDGLFVVCGLWAIVVFYCCVVCRLRMSR